MKKSTFLTMAIILSFLILPPAQAQTKELPKEIKQGFQAHREGLRNKKLVLERKLQDLEALKHRAEAGTRAKDTKIAEENRRAVKIIEQAIATRRRAIRRTGARRRPGG